MIINSKNTDYRDNSLDPNYKIINIEFGSLIMILEARDIVVLEVVPDSPAEKAGIVQNSIIFGVDGNLIMQMADLIKHIQTKVPNDNMILDVMGTDGIRRDVNLTLGNAPQIS